MSHPRFVRVVLTALVAAEAMVVTGGAPAAVAGPDTGPSYGHVTQVARHRALTPLQAQTGLTMAITEVSPAGLVSGRPLRLSGTVTNDGTHGWTDAKVYLSVGTDPALDKAALDAFAADEDGFGTTINDLGLFDEIGRLRPGSRTDWRLVVPFERLTISRAAGVYQVGATLLAGNADGRDSLADARVSTTVPYLPDGTSAPNRTSVVTLLPVTAAVLRHPDGVFVDDRLARLLAYGGRLRNLLDFASRAPAGSLDMVVDPALRQAAKDMSRGYDVQSFADLAQGVGAQAGSGRQVATAWLDELAALRQRQTMSLLPWGGPATSSLVAAGMPGVIDAAVVSSQRYAAANSLSQTVADWQSNGSTTRRALAVSRLAGATRHVVSQRSLPGLRSADVLSYPPPQVTINTRPGPLTAVVTRSDVGGRPFASTMTALEFRQAMMSEATVRALSENSPTSVFAAPFNWNPGNLSAQTDVAAGYHFPTVAAESLAALEERVSSTYTGSLPLPGSTSQLMASTLSAIRHLRDSGRVYSELLTDHRQVSTTFDQQLAAAGSSAWRHREVRGTAMIRELARDLSSKVAEVTVTGPAFVAMSSSTGRFPLTISNGLDAAVTVQISVHPLNPALTISPIEPLELDPGQSKDIEVESTADGSGLTQVRARLSTASNRSFGHPFSFNVRATQIGVAIWVAMGAGLGALLLTAGRRIYSRARGEGFKTRGESAA